jgi:uncharacterized protein GlcG (DUF336 family)
MSISLQEAKSLLERAEAAAAAIERKISVAVVDTHGDLVALSRREGARSFTPIVAYGKAKASALFQRPSESYAEVAETPSIKFINDLNHNDLVFIPGGLPIERDGVVVGALGISGALAAEDAQIVTSTLAEEN